MATRTKDAEKAARNARKRAEKIRRKAHKRADRVSQKARKRAEKTSAEAQERVAALTEKAGQAAQERAAELAERLRRSETFARAQRKGREIAQTARQRFEDSDLDQRAAELADRLQQQWEQAEVERRAAELAKRAREHEKTQQAVGKAKDATDSSLAAVGSWLASSKAGEKMGLRRRRLPLWVIGVLGVLAGFVVGRVSASRSGPSLRDELALSADRLASPEPNPNPTTTLADTVRATLSSDPRTAPLRTLNVNVADGTVFVRGNLPPDAEVTEDAIRSVIAAVPGVTDVDLELSEA